MAATARSIPSLRLGVHWSDRIAHLLLLVFAMGMITFIAAPLVTILAISTEGADGRFVWFENFLAYFDTPALMQSLWNSVWTSLLVTAIVLPAAFAFAYAITRSCMPLKGAFRMVALTPLLAPSLLSALSFIYWFGNQGVLKNLMQAAGLEQIYGAPGIVLAQVFSVFPHALMILITALSLADARLYEAADALGASGLRKFFTITLPGVQYGLISAAMVIFTLAITDFGIPKVIGGNFNVLATDVFKLVIGQQDFRKGAVVALLLLSPALLTFLVDSMVRRRHTSMVGSRAIPYVPRPSRGFDRAMTVYCAMVAVLMLAVIGMVVYASFVKFWPYDLSFSLRHYTDSIMDGEAGSAFLNSLSLALCTSIAGTTTVFIVAYLIEKTRGADWLRPVIHSLSLVPMAVPGLVLGLGYILFFNSPHNPFNFLYHTMAILVVCTIVHFYSTGHLTALTALKTLDAEFESVSASLKVPFWKTFWRVTLPICSPALVDISRYFFINAMTTISAVVFLYSPDTRLIALTILNLDEAGESAGAAAMAVVIAATSLAACLLYSGIGRLIDYRTQRWRRHS